MRIVRVFMWTVPVALLLVGCAPPPRTQPVEMASTRYELGVAYFDAGNYRRAIPELARAVELKPSNPEYRNALGMAFMFTRQLDEAIKMLEEAVEIDPKFSQAKNNLASAYMLKGELEKARVLLLELLDNIFYPTPHFAYFNLAKIFERQGKVDKAIEEYRHALDIERNYVEAHNNLGVLYLQQGNTGLAIYEFFEATRLSPKAVVYHRNLGAAYFRAGKHEEAREVLQRVIELEPNSRSAEYARKVLKELKR